MVAEENLAVGAPILVASNLQKVHLYFQQRKEVEGMHFGLGVEAEEVTILKDFAELEEQVEVAQVCIVVSNP